MKTPQNTSAYLQANACFAAACATVVATFRRQLSSQSPVSFSSFSLDLRSQFQTRVRPALSSLEPQFKQGLRDLYGELFDQLCKLYTEYVHCPDLGESSKTAEYLQQADKLESTTIARAVTITDRYVPVAGNVIMRTDSIRRYQTRAGNVDGFGRMMQRMDGWNFGGEKGTFCLEAQITERQFGEMTANHWRIFRFSDIVDAQSAYVAAICGSSVLEQHTDFVNSGHYFVCNITLFKDCEAPTS